MKSLLKNKFHFNDKRGFSILEVIVIMGFVMAMSYVVLAVVSKVRDQTVGGTRFVQFDIQMNKIRVALAQNSTCWPMLKDLDFSDVPVQAAAAAAAGTPYPLKLPADTVDISKITVLKGSAGAEDLAEESEEDKNITNIAFDYIDFTHIIDPKITLSNGNKAYVVNLTIRGRYLGANFIDKAGKTEVIPVAITLEDGTDKLLSCSIASGAGNAYMCALMDGNWDETKNVDPIDITDPPCEIAYYYL